MRFASSSAEPRCAVDGAGNLFVGNVGAAPVDVTEYAPPYTGAPTTTITSGLTVPRTLLLTP
jgi:hypothetical protein